MRNVHERNNGELCLVFSFSLRCSNPCAPSLLLSERSLFSPNWMSRGALTPNSVPWVYITTTELVYLRSRCQLKELQKSAETDWLKNWRVNAVYFQLSLHSAWRMLVYILIDAHITTWCLEKKKKGLRKFPNVMRFISYSCNINSQCAEFPSPAVVQGYLF